MPSLRELRPDKDAALGQRAGRAVPLYGRHGRRRRAGRARRYVVALLLAVGLHALAVGLWELSGGERVNPLLASKADPHPTTATDEDTPLELQTLVDELEHPEEKTAKEIKKEEELKKEIEQKHPLGQVVELPRPAIEQRPDQAKYVSEFDSKVDRETKAPNSRDKSGAPAAAPTPATPPVPVQPPPAPTAAAAGKKGTPAPAAASEQAAVAPSTAGQEEDSTAAPAAPDGELPMVGRPAQRPRPATAGAGALSKLGAAGGSSSGETPAPPPRPNLIPTREMLERAVGRGAGTLDYLHDVDDGDATALNSKQWKHAVFFNRVKRAVANEWHPDVVYVQHDPTGHIYGVKDRVTVLRVHLNPDGSLVGSDVTQSSGVDFLDDEALAAFKKAQPFQNPPTALVEADGRIHFNFAFVFELSGRTSFKVYKYE